ncbi:MAG: dihydroorotate dehydrogenase [Chloroflexi bacterium]|nr:dihydroorotate dehydrogenase [Chloroflexota bacterium]PKB57011.1 MAG: dihydroorotate dehydrogenase B catalytic subunit [SAR202 cluster bacterium Casp-Chloro-G3]
MSDEGVNLAVDLAPQNPHHLRLSNPIMIASGTFGYDGYGRGLTPEMRLSQLGAVIPKTVTRLSREGNPEPRWYPKSFREAREAGACIYLNSIGLANPGIEAALTDLAPQWANWGATVVLSLSAESVVQFGEMAAMTQGVGGFQAIELNLSCPNVDDGALFGHDAKLAAAATAAVRANTTLPLLVKLAPNVPDITPIAKAVVAAGADALTISNTLPAMTIDVEQRKPVLGGITGGLSGPGLRAVALALVYRAVQAVDVPVIGVGGIFTANDALEFILAGATAVQIGSANLADLWAPFNILEELRAYLEEHSIPDINQLVGAAQIKAPVS